MDIKRKIELWLCQQLAARVVSPQSVTFLPSHGDTDIDPPFGVVGVASLEELIQGRDLYQGDGALQILSHINDTDSEQHAELVQVIKLALQEIQLELPSFSGDYDLQIHGLDIGGMKANDSPEDSAHADIWPLRFGVSG